MTPTPATDSAVPSPQPSPRRAAGDDGSYRSGSTPVGPLPRRVLLRRAGALTAAVALTAACGVRLGEGSPASLPTVSAPEAVRDALARQATLIGSTAQVVARSGAQQATQAEAVAAAAQTQLEAMGGVWDPWATPVPTTYQTVSPAPSAAADADVDDLVSALIDGLGQAREAAAACEDAATARLYAALAVAWSLQARTLNEDAVETSGRDASALAGALPGELLAAYDAARYALEEVAARSTDEARTRAEADVAYAKAIVSASVALDGEDARLAAYAAPTEPADSATSLDVTWARQVWLRVEETELAQVAAAGGEATGSAIDAALYAAERARAWGAAADDPLPGYSA